MGNMGSSTPSACTMINSFLMVGLSSAVGSSLAVVCGPPMGVLRSSFHWYPFCRMLLPVHSEGMTGVMASGQLGGYSANPKVAQWMEWPLVRTSVLVGGFSSLACLGGQGCLPDLFRGQ